jgi:hypothetical protein
VVVEALHDHCGYRGHRWTARLRCGAPAASYRHGTWRAWEVSDALRVNGLTGGAGACARRPKDKERESLVEPLFFSAGPQDFGATQGRDAPSLAYVAILKLIAGSVVPCPQPASLQKLHQITEGRLRSRVTNAAMSCAVQAGVERLACGTGLACGTVYSRRGEAIARGTVGRAPDRLSSTARWRRPRVGEVACIASSTLGSHAVSHRTARPTIRRRAAVTYRNRVARVGGCKATIGAARTGGEHAVLVQHRDAQAVRDVQQDRLRRVVGGAVGTARGEGRHEGRAQCRHCRPRPRAV